MEKNTEFLSLKYGSPYIDFNRLEKNFRIILLHFAQCHFICLFLKNYFVFLFLGQLVRFGHILHTPKLNKFKNGLSVLFAKKLRLFRVQHQIRVFSCLILNTDQHVHNTEFFQLEIRKTTYRLKPFKKKLQIRIFLHCAKCIFVFFLIFLFSFFLGQLVLNRVKNGHSVLFAKKLRVSVLNTKYGFCRVQY